MAYDRVIAGQRFIPVILGGNLSVYSIARNFHMAYGVKSVSISRQLTGPIFASAILQTLIAENMTETEALLASLRELEQTYPGVPKLLLASDDWHVEMVLKMRPHCEGEHKEWIIPYAPAEVIGRVTDKAQFYQLCEDLGVDFPARVVYDDPSPRGIKDLELPFSFPVVVKPVNSMTYSLIHFPGKKKVFIARDRTELERIIEAIRTAQYSEGIILQEFVPGDDSAMHVLTCYMSRDGEMKLASFGQTLLEDHTPSAIGNPLVIRTVNNEEVTRQARRLLEHVGYVGFANFDLKYDRRDGKYKFFEWNARLGRSNYYVTAGGHNTAEYYVRDFIDRLPLPVAMKNKEALFSLIPKRLLLKHTADPRLKQAVKRLYREKKVHHPLKYFAVDRSWKRRYYVFMSMMNYYRKFRKYPPRHEEASWAESSSGQARPAVRKEVL